MVWYGMVWLPHFGTAHSITDNLPCAICLGPEPDRIVHGELWIRQPKLQLRNCDKIRYLPDSADPAATGSYPDLDPVLPDLDPGKSGSGSG